MKTFDLTTIIFNVSVARKNYTDAYHLVSSQEHLRQLASQVDHAERILADYCVDHERELAEWERERARFSTDFHAKDDR